VATTAVATVVPGVIPYVSDRVLDVLGVPMIDVDTEVGPSDHGLYLAAAETVAVKPTDPLRDPRFVLAVTPGRNSPWKAGVAPASRSST
jgi:hypothetical protein